MPFSAVHGLGSNRVVLGTRPIQVVPCFYSFWTVLFYELIFAVLDLSLLRAVFYPGTVVKDKKK